jgi:4-amino-4-deoxy-L-arabinose transferase-like glycosyltransferase
MTTTQVPWTAPAAAPDRPVHGDSRVRRLVRGREADPAWARPTLLVLLAASTVLYTWALGASGWANSYYAAAVQAGSQSWKAFFYGSFDASNYITVDKTPASLWLPALAARVFGMNSWTLLLPEALMGVATVAVVYAAVRRYAGPAAGLIAGAVVATTPVAALIFRFDNPDALLVLLLTVGAYATLRAVETGRTRWLVLAGTMIGFGFLAKMLQAFLVLPAFTLAYLLFGPPKLGRRIGQLLAGGLAVLVSAGWWVAIVELVPASSRPYIGGSTSNSILELTLGYNGLGRLTGNETGSVVPGGGGQRPGAGMWGETGLFRLFTAENGGQAAWLLPAALAATAAGLYAVRRAPRTDPLRASLVVWGGWLLVTAAVFSFMAGIFHAYYLVALAPPLGALVGTGSVLLWRRRHELWARVALAAALAGTGIWAAVLLDRVPDWHPELRSAVVVGAAAGAVGLLVPALLTGRRALGVAAVGLVAVLAAPGAYAVATVAQPHTGAIPSAGPAGAALGGPGGGRVVRGLPPGGQNGPGGFPGGFPGGTGQGGQGGQGGLAAPGGGTGARGGPGGSTTVGQELVTLLRQDADGYQWAAATTSASGAAPYQLASGEPVLAVGGFNGTDQSTTLAAFQQLVAAGKVHYWIGGGGFGGAQVGGVANQIASWVAENFEAQTVGGTTVYDLTSAATG